MTAWFAAEILAAVLIVLAVKLRRVTNNCAEQKEKIKEWERKDEINRKKSEESSSEYEETIRELKRESTVGLQRERDKERTIESLKQEVALLRQEKGKPGFYP